MSVNNIHILYPNLHDIPYLAADDLFLTKAAEYIIFFLSLCRLFDSVSTSSKLNIETLCVEWVINWENLYKGCILNLS